MKFWFYLFIFITLYVEPGFSQNQTLKFSTQLTAQSKHFLGLQNNLRSSENSVAKFNINYASDNLSSQLTLNYDGTDNFILDESYFQYTSGIVTYGIGAIDRHWSLSNNTSLILSHNARPSQSIYLKLKNRFGYHWLPSKANWSIEAFNRYTKG